MSKLRLLCLHGYGQDGEGFRAKSGSLRKDIKKIADCVFVTSPQQIQPDAAPGVGRPDHKETDPAAGPGYLWWDFTQELSQMRGYDESVAFIAQVFEEQGPFDGVLAFSQGAGFLALLIAQLQRGELPPSIAFRFGVLVAERLPLQFGKNPHNTKYLETKAGKLGHMLGQLHQAEAEAESDDL